MPRKHPSSAFQAQIRLLEHQIYKIKQEIHQRQELSTTILQKLKKQLDTYQSAKNNRMKLPDHSAGHGYQEDREHVNQLIRETESLIRQEETSSWNDIQKLQEEKRFLEKEKSQLEFNLSLVDQS